ncbi:MAG: magnesium/cobalt transporter CorA [Gammaproteobacteria bacterium]|nr:magnesium/cobalt transporter CorA [Gammaproteobacteria bacterium]
MLKPLTSASEKAGLPPGSLVYVGEEAQQDSKITVTIYDAGTLEEQASASIDDILQIQDKVIWLSVEGLKNVEFIESLGKAFNIHALVLEDILNTQQRAKCEEFDDYIYIVAKALVADLSEGVRYYDFEQISIILLKNIVLTFKEKQDDLFQPLKQRLSISSGRMRVSNADYLAYVLLDSIVDQYFSVQDDLESGIDMMEEDLIERPTPEMLVSLQRIKRTLIELRKSVSPMRDVMIFLGRADSPLIEEKTRIYLRDIYDHVTRITEDLDSTRDLVNGMLEIYLSSMSNKLNEVMKVLTVFASIFIPLTFLAGIYGMNFEYMPELKWRWAYPALWAVFVITPVALLVYFKRRKWL